MPLPLIPLAIVALGGTAWHIQGRKKTATVTPQVAAERAVIYDTALNTVKDPDKLRLLAKAFKDSGLNAESDMLIKRAALAEAPQEVKDARRKAFKDGMSSTNVDAILNLANEFEKTGAVGAATSLREYAKGLEVAATQEGATS